MKRIILLAFCLFSTILCFSQTKQDIILVGTSTLIPGDFVGIFDGFGRTDVLKEDRHKDNPYFFSIGDSRAVYEIMLCHYNHYNKKRPDLLVSDVKISDLTADTYPNAQIINIDEYFANKTKEDVWYWMWYHRTKNRTKLWIADYSSAYKSMGSLSEPDMIKVVQVEIPISTVWAIEDDIAKVVNLTPRILHR